MCYLELRSCLIITLCTQTQEKPQQCETTLSVLEGTDEMIEIKTKKKNILVSVFIILDK